MNIRMRKFITWDHGMSKEAFIKLQEWLKDKQKDSDAIRPIQNFIDMKNEVLMFPDEKEEG